MQRWEAAVARRPSLSPPGPSPGLLRVATWNLNSLRVRRAAVERFLERAAPDVLCLQETKKGELSADAEAMFRRLGYGVAYVGSGSYNGVAIVSRHPLADVQVSGSFGDEHLDREPRLSSCVVHAAVPVRVASVYVPHGRQVGHWHYDYKLAFLAALAVQVRRWLADGHLVLAGDVNVAATDSDVFHPDAFVGVTHVTAPERALWADVLDAGLVDVDAALHGWDARRFTWWNHGISYARDLGMRIDVIAADRRLAATVRSTWIDHVERNASRPSDHAALVADFDATAVTGGIGPHHPG
jgi:exodeoxyribonuclease-3